MGLFKDEQGSPQPEGDDDFRLPSAAEEDDVTEQIRRNPDPEPSGVSEMSFDDDEHEEDYLDEDLEDLPDPDTYVTRKSGSDNRKKSTSGFQLGKGSKILGFAAAVVGVMVVLMAAFGGGGDSPTAGPAEGELAAANQQKVELRARELMEQRLEVRQQKLEQIRAKRAKARAEAEAEREAALAAAKAKRKAAAAEAAKAETTVVSEPETSYTPPPTYTYTPPPAPAPEPAPAPAPEPAPVETQAQVNQSTANSSFGFGG